MYEIHNWYNAKVAVLFPLSTWPITQEYMCGYSQVTKQLLSWKHPSHLCLLLVDSEFKHARCYTHCYPMHGYWWRQRFLVSIIWCELLLMMVVRWSVDGWYTGGRTSLFVTFCLFCQFTNCTRITQTASHIFSILHTFPIYLNLSLLDLSNMLDKTESLPLRWIHWNLAHWQNWECDSTCTFGHSTSSSKMLF